MVTAQSKETDEHKLKSLEILIKDRRLMLQTLFVGVSPSDAVASRLSTFTKNRTPAELMQTYVKLVY